MSLDGRDPKYFGELDRLLAAERQAGERWEWTKPARRPKGNVMIDLKNAEVMVYGSRVKVCAACMITGEDYCVNIEKRAFDRMLNGVDPRAALLHYSKDVVDFMRFGISPQGWEVEAQDQIRNDEMGL